MLEARGVATVVEIVYNLPNLEAQQDKESAGVCSTTEASWKPRGAGDYRRWWGAAVELFRTGGKNKMHFDFPRQQRTTGMTGERVDNKRGCVCPGTAGTDGLAEANLHLWGQLQELKEGDIVYHIPLELPPVEGCKGAEAAVCCHVLWRKDVAVGSPELGRDLTVDRCARQSNAQRHGNRSIEYSQQCDAAWLCWGSSQALLSMGRGGQRSPGRTCEPLACTSYWPVTSGLQRSAAWQ